MTQRAQILSHLKSGKSITPLEALTKFGSFRLSERIREIQAQGHVIEKDWHETDSGSRVRKYWLG